MALMLTIDTPPLHLTHARVSLAVIWCRATSSSSFGVHKISNFPKTAKFSIFKNGTALLFLFTFSVFFCTSAILFICVVWESDDPYITFLALSFISFFLSYVSTCLSAWNCHVFSVFFPQLWLHVNLFCCSLQSAWWKDARLTSIWAPFSAAIQLTVNYSRADRTSGYRWQELGNMQENRGRF